MSQGYQSGACESEISVRCIKSQGYERYEVDMSETLSARVYQSEISVRDISQVDMSETFVCAC